MDWNRKNNLEDFITLLQLKTHIFRVCMLKGGCAGVELLWRVRFKSHQLKLNWSWSWAVTITHSFFIEIGPKMTQIKNLFIVLWENLKICSCHNAKICENRHWKQPIFTQFVFLFGSIFFWPRPQDPILKKSAQIVPLSQKLGLTQVNLSFKQREIYSITLSKFIRTFNFSLKLRLT